MKINLFSNIVSSTRILASNEYFTSCGKQEISLIFTSNIGETKCNAKVRWNKHPTKNLEP